LPKGAIFASRASTEDVMEGPGEKGTMRHWTGWLLGLGAAAALAAPALAVEEGACCGEAPAKAEITLRGEYAIMANECGLDDAQKEALATALTAKDEAMKAGREKAGTLKKDLAAAKEAGDEEAVQRLGEETKALREELRALQIEHRAKILACLTPEQRETWEGFVVYRNLMRRYAKAELDDAQKTQVRAMANEAAKEMMAVQGDEKDIHKAKEEIGQRLMARIEAEVLTAEQKEKMHPPAEEPKAEAVEEVPAAPEPAAEKGAEAPKEAEAPLAE